MSVPSELLIGALQGVGFTLAAFVVSKGLEKWGKSSGIPVPRGLLIGIPASAALLFALWFGYSLAFPSMQLAVVDLTVEGPCTSYPGDGIQATICMSKYSRPPGMEAEANILSASLGPLTEGKFWTRYVFMPVEVTPTYAKTVVYWLGLDPTTEFTSPPPSTRKARFKMLIAYKNRGLFD